MIDMSLLVEMFRFLSKNLASSEKLSIVTHQDSIERVCTVVLTLTLSEKRFCTSYAFTKP